MPFSFVFSHAVYGLCLLVITNHNDNTVHSVDSQCTVAYACAGVMLNVCH